MNAAIPECQPPIYRRHRARRCSGDQAVAEFAQGVCAGQPPRHPRADARDQPAETPASMGAEINPPIYVYDCSGPYTDPAVKIDIRSGLAALREGWIAERGDTETLDKLTSDYGRQRLNDPELAEMRFNLRAQPRRAKAGKNVSQMHYARAASSRRRWNSSPSAKRHAPPRISRAAEDVRSDGQQAGRTDGPPASGPVLRRRSCRKRSRRNSCATKSRAAAPSSPPTSTTRKPSR